MADPLSISSGTAGLVSLGIEVCGGLLKYCRAWKSHDKDVEDAQERLTELESILKSMADILSTVESLDSSVSEPLLRARKSIRSCNSALRKLQSFLAECESISKPEGIFDKLHNVRVRSSSFFSKARIRSLQGSITEFQANLASATSALNIHMLLQQRILSERLAEDTKKQLEKLPSSIESVLIERLDTYGSQLSILKQDVLNATSQNAVEIQQVTQNISSLQFGMIRSPGLLKSTIEEQQRLQSSLTKHERSDYRHCRCLRSSSRWKPSYARDPDSKQALPLGGWFPTAFRSTVSHRKNCLFFEEIGCKREVGLMITHSGALLRGTVKASFSMIRSSGGFTISQSLSFSSVVPSSSRVFNITSSYLWGMDLNYYSFEKRLALATEDLSRLFAEGKASPDDVDECGDTLLHEAARWAPYLRLIWRQPSMHELTNQVEWEGFCEIYLQYMQKLHELGTPLNQINDMGETPFGLIVAKAVDGLPRSFIVRLHDMGADFLSQAPPSYYLRVHYATAYNGFPELAEIFGCNEVSLAILSRSLSALRSALIRSPQSINEPNRIGQTPLHLGVDWPECMSVLLNAGAAVDARDDFDWTPVFYAVVFGCLESLRLLIQADCVLHTVTVPLNSSVLKTLTLLDCAVGFENQKPEYWRSQSRDGLIPSIEAYGAIAIVDEVIQTIAQRRRVLEAFVYDSLPSKIVNSFQLTSGSVLDNKASLVISALKDQQIHLPECLIGLTDEDTSVYYTSGLTERQAQALWDNGFREIDCFDKKGRTPLMAQLLYNITSVPEMAEIFEWFRLKGANLHKRQISHNGEMVMTAPGNMNESSVSGISRPSAMHCMAWQLAGYMHYLALESQRQILFPEAYAHSMRTAFELVLTDTFSDTCSCSCCGQGCRGFTVMASLFMWACFRDRGHAETIRRFLSVLQNLPLAFDLDSSNLNWLYLDVLRVGTFTTLGLRHTCCVNIFENLHSLENAQELSSSTALMSLEEMREIHEEQAELEEDLEILLEEFEEQYKQSGGTFAEFLNGYWKDRMEDILNRKKPIDKTQLESIGVILHDLDYETGTLF